MLDFEDLEGLPCPCDDRHVCLLASERCVPRESVDPFKSCPTDTPLSGSETCRLERDATGRVTQDYVCAALNGQGPRCLPVCAPVPYGRRDAGRLVANRCPTGTTCWSVPTGDSPAGGVCSEGICEESPNTCPATQRCARFNGAGVCFTECSVYDRPSGCGADQVCQLIGLANLTACVAAGPTPTGGLCNQIEGEEPLDDMCQRQDTGSVVRPLICAHPDAATDRRDFCLPVCSPADGSGCLPGELCLLARANVYPSTGQGVGVCGLR